LSFRRVLFSFAAPSFGNYALRHRFRPAGTACAKALLQRGAEVLMLDAGIELENDRAKNRRELSENENFPAGPREKVAEIKKTA